VKNAHPSEVQRKIDRFRDLSHELLRYANLGLLRTDFLPKVSEKILDFSGADAVELWVKEDDRKHYRCTVSRSKKMPFGFILVPCALGEEAGPPPADRRTLGLEVLCCKVIHGMRDRVSTCFTDKGSFWTGDAEGCGLASSDRSLALLRIGIEEECIGLLHLKSMKRDYFSAEELTFYEDISELLGIAVVHQHAQIELRERIKELTCLYGIAQVVARPEASTDEVLLNIVDLLPPAWLHPKIACARIVLNGQSYTTQGFQETPYRQTSDILVNGERLGFVEVAYKEKRLTRDEGPFLLEERSLIDSVSREVAHFYERTRTEEEKASLHGQLRHADRLATIGQLAAGVAHELNEPLGNILGFAQLAKKTPDLPEQAEEDLKCIETASLHAREIIKKLMVFARQMPPEKVLVRLNKVVEEGLYYFEARCEKAGIDLVRRLDPGLPRITADPGQLNQVLVNLVVNAIQAMPAGGTITVETRAGMDQVLLAVEDTGMGMPEDVKKHIFLPFYTTKDVNEGTGLGLPVVHGIVTSHKGNITVETEEGKGTRFIIQFPANGPEKSEPEG